MSSNDKAPRRTLGRAVRGASLSQYPSAQDLLGILEREIQAFENGDRPHGPATRDWLVWVRSTQQTLAESTNRIGSVREEPK